MSFTLVSATLSQLVLAHDSGSADMSSLSDAWAARSDETISAGLRWSYCGGLAVALASMGVISATHIHKDIRGARVRKAHRLVLRFCVAVVLVCLPLASSLSSLSLIACTTGLTVFVLVADLYGTSCVGDGFFWMDKSPKNCQYEAYCPTLRHKDLANAIRTGEKLKVEDLAASLGESEKGGLIT